jgi:hypothetical protein
LLIFFPLPFTLLIQMGENAKPDRQNQNSHLVVDHPVALDAADPADLAVAELAALAAGRLVGLAAMANVAPAAATLR